MPNLEVKYHVDPNSDGGWTRAVARVVPNLTKVAFDIDFSSCDPENVLQVVIDHLRQRSKQDASREKSIAITKIEEAVLWLGKEKTPR